MNYFLQWQQPQMLYWLVPVLLLAAWIKLKYGREVRYRYSLTRFLPDYVVSRHLYKACFFLMRLTALGMIAALIAMPRWVEVDSRIPVEGIDIVLVMDASGSMSLQDDPSDARTRFQVAKDEAIRFIEKRDNDAIGLVLFANDALSRIPITMDKQMLKEVINDLHIGFIDPDGTLLFTGILTAANRLKHSNAKSKIMILLTDGEPSDGDMHAQSVMDLVKQLGIKIYTIGVGSDQMRYITHQFGLMPVPPINKSLLTHIAAETGGKFFLARNSKDMRQIYDTIDRLEKTQLEVPIFTRWYDLAFSLIWVILALLCVELFYATYIWFSI